MKRYLIVEETKPPWQTNSTRTAWNERHRAMIIFDTSTDTYTKDWVMWHQLKIESNGPDFWLEGTIPSMANFIKDANTNQ
jgi:hypothetical protein